MSERARAKRKGTRSWNANMYGSKEKRDSVLEREHVRQQRERTRTVIISKKLPKRVNGLLYKFDVNVFSIYSVYFNILLLCA